MNRTSLRRIVRFLALAWIIGSAPGLARAGGEDLSGVGALFHDRAHTRPAPTFETHGVRVSDTESCRRDACAAVKVATGARKPRQDAPRAALAGGKNPTSLYCRALAGRPAIFYRENGNEVSVCLFGDGSFALAWDLMNRAGT